MCQERDCDYIEITTNIDNLLETSRYNLPSNFFTFMEAKDDSSVDKGDNCIDKYNSFRMYTLLNLQHIQA